jgi:peptide/nickel transport system ATP-binding protein
MAKKKEDGYLSAREAHRISRENRKITNAYEKQRKRKNVPESEYLTQMKDWGNSVEFDNLHTYFFTDAGTVRAVDGVSFDVPIGKTVGVVGESGCGKSVTSLSLMQLLQRPQGQVVEGEIRLNLGGKAYDVTKTPNEVLQKLRGNYVSMIFQEPMTALNPVFRIGDQINEVIALHDGEGKSEEDIKKRTIDLLEMVGIANSEGVYKMYPHELSGGMRQRVVIAMALACNPKIIIADEPTTALDVTIQAQILDLMKSLQEELGMAIIMITHDLGVVAQMCDEVIVMYAGSICEQGTADEIFYNPCHEYTKGLLRSIPTEGNDGQKLEPITGTPIDLLNMPKGCPFAPRCDNAMKICLRERAERMQINDDHAAGCWMNVKKQMEGGEKA